MNQKLKILYPPGQPDIYLDAIPVSSALGKPKTKLQDSSDEHVCLALWRVQMSLLITLALLT